MTAFRAFLFLLPALLALTLPALLTWRLEQDRPREAARDGSMAGGLLLLLSLVAGLVAGEPLRLLLGAALFSAAFTILAVGFYVFLVQLRARPAAAQAASGLLVILLTGSVFLAGSVIGAAPLAAKAGRADLLVRVNPYAVMGSDLLGVDVLHGPALYASHLADYVRGTPAWPGVAAGYAALGALLAGAGLGFRRATEAR